MTKENNAPSMPEIIGMQQGRIKAIINFLETSYDDMTSSSTRKKIVELTIESLKETINQSEKLFQQHLDSYK